MKGIILQPVIADENVLVQFTDTVVTDKNTQIKVPNGYSAIVLIDEKIAFRMNAGAGKRIAEYGKEYINRQCKAAFVRTKQLPSMLWGFGNIQVNNERLNEAYSVGANGQYSVQIAEAGKLIGGLDVEQNITTDMIREKTISVLKNIGTAVLGSYFSGTDISVFEIASKTVEIREALLRAIEKERTFVELGLLVKDLTVDSIHVREEDLELIRSRINNTVTITENTNNSQGNIKEELARLQRELSTSFADEIYKSEQRLKAEQGKSVVTELEKSRAEITQSVLEQVQKQLAEFGENIASELEDMITDKLPLREEAKPENIEKIKLTARKVWELSDKNDDMTMLAGKIYSKVEKNLILKFKLPHKDEKFYMDYKEYVKTASTIKINGKFPLMRMDRNGSLKILPPRVFEENEDGSPKFVEMHPFIRFMKAGLTTEEAKRATEMWSILNKMRHSSAENQAYLEKFFQEHKPAKQYIKDVLDFYSEKWLYTED